MDLNLNLIPCMKTNSKCVIVLYAKQKTIKLPSLQWNDGLELEIEGGGEQDGFPVRPNVWTWVLPKVQLMLILVGLEHR